MIAKVATPPRKYSPWRDPWRYVAITVGAVAGVLISVGIILLIEAVTGSDII